MTHFKLVRMGFALGIFLSTSAFTNDEQDGLDLDSFKTYQREYKSTSIGACSTSDIKTYEDYRLITSPTSAQYQYIQNHMTVDSKTGMLYNEDGFLGAALGYSFGEIGTEYYFILDTGIILPIVKVDAKSAAHATNGCSATDNSSVIEFVIDPDIAATYFKSSNGLVSNGNFNNFDAFKGKIVDVQKVSDEKLEAGVVYDTVVEDTLRKTDTMLLEDPR